HHRGIPLGGPSRGDKILVHLREMAPVAEARPLARRRERRAMTAIERIQAALQGLGLKAVEARLEGLLEQAAKKEPSYFMTRTSWSTIWGERIGSAGWAGASASARACRASPSSRFACSASA